MHSPDHGAAGARGFDEVKIITPTDDSEWLAIRRQGIGGSEAGAILGLVDFKSAFEVYAEKLGLLPPKPDNEQMRLGRDLESYVAARFSEAAGKTVAPNGKTIYRCDERPWMQATPDYWVDGENAGLECKTMGENARYDLDAGEIPPGYYAQCVHCMTVTGADRWYLAIYKFGLGLRWFTINRDMLEIDALIRAEEEFWRGCVMAEIPPALTGSDGEAAAIKAIAGRARDRKEIQLYHLAEEVEGAFAAGRQIESLSTERDALIQTIKLAMGDAEIGLTPRYKVFWKNTKTSRRFEIREMRE